MRRPAARRAVAAVLVATCASLAVACGGGGKDKTPPKRTTTTLPPPPTTAASAVGVAPLTGLAGSDPAKISRPALIVKIDNAPKARPQVGINQADIVVEEGVEGGITRFAAMFHSGDSDPVGPVRSARSSDLAIATPLKNPLFAYSGTNDIFEGLLNRSALVNVGVGRFPGGYYRDRARSAPYNLFSRTSALFAQAPKTAVPPPPQFAYLATGATFGGDAASGLHVEFRGNVVTSVDWAWDAATRTWKRTQNGTAHVDGAGRQVSAANLVVLFVTYKDTGIRDQSGAAVPEAQLSGEGEAWVFADGRVAKGRWHKPSLEAVTSLTGGDGKVIALTPGQSWVELPVAGLAQVRP